MEKSALLLFCCLIVPLSGSPLYPSIRFGQRDTSILMTSSIKNPAEQLEEEASPPREMAGLRFIPKTLTEESSVSGRHADAIFTNSYRKVLGQISARKFLQTIMGKRLGYAKRHSDMFGRACKEDLTSILSNQRYRAVPENAMRPRLRVVVRTN